LSESFPQSRLSGAGNAHDQISSWLHEAILQLKNKTGLLMIAISWDGDFFIFRRSI
jgi:hypothetical protein